MDSAIITSVKEFGYNILAFREKRNNGIGGCVAVIYKISLVLPNTKTNSFNSFEHLKYKVR